MLWADEKYQFVADGKGGIFKEPRLEAIEAWATGYKLRKAAREAKVKETIDRMMKVATEAADACISVPTERIRAGIKAGLAVLAEEAAAEHDGLKSVYQQEEAHLRKRIKELETARDADAHRITDLVFACKMNEEAKRLDGIRITQVIADRDDATSAAWGMSADLTVFADKCKDVRELMEERGCLNAVVREGSGSCRAETPFDLCVVCAALEILDRKEGKP